MSFMKITWCWLILPLTSMKKFLKWVEAAARIILCAEKGVPPRQVSVTSDRSSRQKTSLESLLSSLPWSRHCSLSLESSMPDDISNLQNFSVFNLFYFAQPFVWKDRKDSVKLKWN